MAIREGTAVGDGVRNGEEVAKVERTGVKDAAGVAPTEGEGVGKLEEDAAGVDGFGEVEYVGVEV